MSLNSTDRKVILASPVMLERVAGCVLQYANYLANFPSATPGEQSWADQAVGQADVVARDVAPLLYQDTNIAGVVTGSAFSCGSSITEAQLQAAVETVIQDHFIVEPV
jgi:hypothetical protein